MNDLGKLLSEIQDHINATASRLEHISSTTTGSWIFGLLTAGAVVLICYWIPEKRLPPPGYSIAALALLGVLISLHGDSRPWQKVLYFVLAGSFLWIEIRAIKKDRREIYTEQAALRAEDKIRFMEIVNGLKNTLAENQDHFNATASRFEKITSMITGGESFCYMELGQSFLGRVEELLVFVNHGEDPLYDVTATVVDLHSNENKIIDVGNIAARGARRLPALPFTPDHTDFTIMFNARNGNWIEQLRYREVGSARRKALKVTRAGSEEILYELVDKGFPTDAAGKVNWHSH